MHGVTDIKQWMINFKIKMNDSKTEYIVLGSRQQLSKFATYHIAVGADDIKCVDNVKNLGVWLDKHLKFDTHINSKCRTASHSLHCIRTARKFLTPEACQVLVHGMVHSQLDYCN